MIPELLLLGVGLILDGIGLLLPSIDIPYEDELADFSGAVGSRFQALNGFIPVSEFATALAWVGGVYIPARYGWIMFLWLWSRVPFL